MMDLQRKWFLFPLFFILLPILILFGFESYERSNDLKIIENPASFSETFNTAAKHLRNYRGHASFWLKIAGDPKYEAERRRFCARQFFAHFVKPGMEFQEVLKIIHVPANWIPAEQIFEFGNISGVVPGGLNLSKGGKVYVLRILPGDRDKYWVDVLIQLPELVSLDDVQNAFAGKAISDVVSYCAITNCVACDSDDEARL